jgi:hypothetical protein
MHTVKSGLLLVSRECGPDLATHPPTPREVEVDIIQSELWPSVGVRDHNSFFPGCCDRVLDIDVAEICLKGARVVPRVRQRITTGMSEHVRTLVEVYVFKTAGSMARIDRQSLHGLGQGNARHRRLPNQHGS